MFTEKRLYAILSYLITFALPVLPCLSQAAKTFTPIDNHCVHRFYFRHLMNHSSFSSLNFSSEIDQPETCAGQVWNQIS